MNQECILLVDDEAALADLLKRYLERLGYLVDACGDAGTALALARGSPGRYALVIADLTLPDMNGAELVEKLRQSLPRFPALITSGYPYQSSMDCMEFLQKPFPPKMLAEAIERVLRRES